MRSMGRESFARVAVLGGLFGLIATLAGCAGASYAVPGRGADMRLLGAAREQDTDASIAQAMGRRPLASLPAAIAVVRVQAPNYQSDTAQTYGTGAYTVVT